MELEARLNDLAAVARNHRDVLLTEEAAKTALVMPFLQALGYDVFNPAEVVPEFTCDVGTKKGEKVDYAICSGEQVRMLIECKPASSSLDTNHASQFFRYFSVTNARFAILTNGIVFKFFSDTDDQNKMDEKPFFTFQLDMIKKTDVRTLSSFTKSDFDIDKIVAEAGNMKMQRLVANELSREFENPSDEFVRIIAGHIHEGRLTSSIKENFKNLIVASMNSLIREKVNDRLTSALNVSNPSESDGILGGESAAADIGIVTTQDEIDGFNIIRAIASRSLVPNRIVMRDAKSYCAILLDNNNRKTIARLHFNSPTSRYLGCFSGKEETRYAVDGPVDLYKFEAEITRRIVELQG